MITAKEYNDVKVCLRAYLSTGIVIYRVRSGFDPFKGVP